MSNVIRLWSRQLFSLFCSCTIEILFCRVSCWAVFLFSWHSRSSVLSQRLKIDRALQAASLIGSSRTNPVPAANVATAPMIRRVLLWDSSTSVDRRLRWFLGDAIGGKNDLAISLKILSFFGRQSLLSSENCTCWSSDVAPACVI